MKVFGWNDMGNLGVLAQRSAGIIFRGRERLYAVHHRCHENCWCAGPPMTRPHVLAVFPLALLLILGVMCGVPVAAHAAPELCDTGQGAVSSFETPRLVVAICQLGNDFQYRQLNKQDQVRLDLSAHGFPIYGKWVVGRAFEAQEDGCTYQIFTFSEHVGSLGANCPVLLSEDGLSPSR
ncbi:hypothetical protein [Mycobacteroides chelonae]|uniref:hypothetical protein n=1 Tax=Mycobacteroides chelonae TaxID=1774 RepID=UPI0012FF7320|nr:hypothetical protein [Mycobacteroides chelonae]